MIELARYTVERIVPLIGHKKSRINLEGYDVKTGTPKLRCFQRSLSCARCRRAGTLFVLEYHENNVPRGINCYVVDCMLCNMLIQKDREEQRIQPLLNLYHVDRRGRLVLMTMDHILPRSRGGGNDMDNLQTMCRECNTWKGDKYPIG